MRLRLKKIVQYLFLASFLLLMWREFEWLEIGQDTAGASDVHQPLVAGVGPQPPGRRSVGGGGDGGDSVREGGAGRGPLWQNNQLVNHVQQQQRDIPSVVDLKSDNFDDIARQQNEPKHILRLNNNNRPINQTKPELSKSAVVVNVPSYEKTRLRPVNIDGLSKVVDQKPVPVANITIVVHNPGDIPSEPQITKQTELSEIFIGVKTTGKYHRDRLQVILDTWFSLAPEQTNFFTDEDDVEFQRKSNGHMVNTQCQATHSRLALCCKTSVMFNMFLKSNKKWLCHVDDDNYLNVPELMKLLRQYNHNQDYYLGRASLSHPIEAIDREANQRVSFWFATGGAGFCISRSLAMKMAVYGSIGTFERMCNRIRLPDDVTIGFIIEVLLKKPLTKVQKFNSHLQQLRSIPQHELAEQITLSYSITQKRINTINIHSSLYNNTEDPTRFKTFHCTYFRGFGNCPPGR